MAVQDHNDLKWPTYLGAPFPQAPTTLHLQQDQLCLGSTQVRAHQPVQCTQKVQRTYFQSKNAGQNAGGELANQICFTNN